MTSAFSAVRPVLVFCLTFTFISSHSASAGENWPEFRGPHADGHADAKAAPLNWSETEHVKWKTPVPGKAWSSPVVWGDQIWVTNATEDGKRLSALCVDFATGKAVHDVTVFEVEKPAFCYPTNSYASSTPVIEAGRFYAHYGSAGTACVDTATGKLLWSRQDLPCNHYRGPGSSPILYQNLLIVNFDGYDFQYVVALDKTTGATVWKKDRNIDYGTDNGDLKKAFCTPTVIDFGGRKQLISPASAATISYNPLTGEELWKVRHGGFNTAIRPFLSHGMVILAMEGGMKLLAVRPDGKGDVTDTHVAWKCNKGTPTRPSPIVVGDLLFMVSDAGILSCLDVKDGKILWTERIGSPHSASPIFAAGRLYFFSEDGQSRVIAPQKEYKLLAENKLAAGCMATPAVAGDSLIIRTKTDLYRIVP